MDRALKRIAARAGELDREPHFPSENFTDLAAAGALISPSDGLAVEARLVRAVACADASTARILDGHLNGVERLTLTAPEPLRSAELSQIHDGELLLGVWGADPAPGEGTPARLHESDGRFVLRGVKTFCSGAGGVQRALVVAGDAAGSRRLAYVDTASGLSIDRAWYGASGLRSSESHRVEFNDTPVLALLGEPGELSREPSSRRPSRRSIPRGWTRCRHTASGGCASRGPRSTVGSSTPRRNSLNRTEAGLCSTRPCSPLNAVSRCMSARG
jgi:alkylation response protein AidB-like acyl-CoA dehydrogenase